MKPLALLLMLALAGGAARADEARILVGKRYQVSKRSSLLATGGVMLALGAGLAAGSIVSFANQPPSCDLLSRCNDFASPALFGTILAPFAVGHLVSGITMLIVGAQSPEPAEKLVLLTRAELAARARTAHRMAVGGGVAAAVSLAVTGVGAGLLAANVNANGQAAGGALVGVGAAAFLPSLTVFATGMARGRTLRVAAGGAGVSLGGTF